MSPDELDREVTRILAEVMRVPQPDRLRWLQDEIANRIPGKNYEFVFQLVATTVVIVNDELNLKALKTQLIVSGVCLIIGMILAFSFNQPNGIQYLFMRALLTLGFVGVAVGILMGTVKLSWTIARSLAVTATGGFALLILIYFFNPPAPPSPTPDNSPKLVPTNAAK